jgi:hypothetical protein
VVITDHLDPEYKKRSATFSDRSFKRIYPNSTARDARVHAEPQELDAAQAVEQYDGPPAPDCGAQAALQYDGPPEQYDEPPEQYDESPEQYDGPPEQGYASLAHDSRLARA